jgi:predicted secreted Zn-dependent protease
MKWALLLFVYVNLNLNALWFVVLVNIATHDTQHQDLARTHCADINRSMQTIGAAP